MQQDAFYDVVAGELRERVLQPGLWTRAYAEADGDERRARAIYIKLRVAQLTAADETARMVAQQEAEKAQLLREQEDKRRREEELMANWKADTLPTSFQILIVVVIVFVFLYLFFLTDRK